MASIERLYDLYTIISDAKDAGSKHEGEYEEIISAVKGGVAERQLSSQFISKFFYLFPNLQEQALNSHFDLCEDEEISVRRQGIKDLPCICKAKPEVIPKVADILAQLLQMDDAAEIITVQNSLVALFKLDAKGTLTGLFYQIENSENESVRERCMKFLQAKLKILGQEVFKPECEDLIVKEAKTVLQNASEEEFLLMMAILKELKVTKSLKGYQQMVDLVADQCDLSQSINPSDPDTIHRLASCLKQAIPYFSSQIRSTKFVDYLCREALPFLHQLETGEDNSVVASSLDLLRTLAEMMPHAGDLEDLSDKVNTVFNQLLEVMPLPPDTDSVADSAEEVVSLAFSRVECLLYVFHSLAKSVTDFLAENPARLKDFRLRLQYFARGSQAYQKKLRESLADKKGPELKTEENSIKLIALKTTANINALIKDLFHQPPSYKTSITLSWKVGSKSVGEKRHAPITFEGSRTTGPKAPRSDRQIYAPPRDKYSSGSGSVPFTPRGRGGRGGYRGYNNFRGGYRRY